MKPKTIIIIVLLVLLVVILIQNSDTADFYLFFWGIKVSKIILVPLLVLFGFIIGFLVAKLGGQKKTH
jgi:uncharacterized integral membrane protein